MTSCIKKALAVLSILMVVYHAVASQYLYFGQWEHQTIHLLLIFLLCFLSFAAKASSGLMRSFIGACVLAGVLCCLYIYANIEELEASQGFPTETAVWVGCVLIAVTMIGTYMAWGVPLLVVAVTFVGYFLWGDQLSGPLYHAPYSFDYVISFLSVGLSGIYGTFLSISADQVFLFVVFGSMLTIFKVEGMFMEIGKILGRYMRGGPGMTAVISNALIGMVSGAPVASVAITGPFVMPYMKKSGYDEDEAGGIVACAATGSQLMPPVMGAAAFLMATFIGQPYSVVMLAGILPAVLFYFAAAMGVQCMAVAKEFTPVEMDVDWGIIVRRLPVFIAPIALIFAMLLMRYSPAMTAFWACVVTMVVGYARKETRPTLQELLASLQTGAVTGAKIGISLALIGLVAQTLVSTGMGTKLASLINYIAEGQLFIALVVTMLVALILGCAVPPAAAYALCAIVVVPTLTHMGVDLLRAHMYCFYFSIISAVTPPVGLASLAASGITGGSYWKTSVHGFKLSCIGFVLPFMIVYNPVFSFDMSNPVWALSSLVSITATIVAISALLYGALHLKLNGAEKLLAASIVVLGVWHIFGGSGMNATVSCLVALSTGALLAALYMLQKRRDPALAAGR